MITRAGEVDPRVARYPIAAVGVTAAALIAIKTGRDAAFFSQRGLENLPMAYVTAQLGLAAAAVVHVQAMKRCEPMDPEEAHLIQLPDS